MKYCPYCGAEILNGAVSFCSECGGNRRLPLAALNNRDFVVWTGHFVSLLSVIGGWGDVLPPHFEQKKSRKPFKDFLLGGAAGGRLVFSFKSSGQVGLMIDIPVKFYLFHSPKTSLHI